MAKMIKNRRKGVNRGVDPSLKRAFHQILEASKEKKAFASTVTYTDAVAATATEVSRPLVQGDTINTRDGDAIKPFQLEINYSFINGALSTNSFHRIVIIQDTMNDGLVPLFSEVMEGGLYISPKALRPGQQHRYKIIHDQLHGVVGASNSAAVHVQKKIPMRGMIYYNGNSATATDNGRNAIFMYTLTDSVAVATAVFRAYWVIHYTDA